MGLALLSVAAAAAVVNAFADRFASWSEPGSGGPPEPADPPDGNPRLRGEDFGAILSWHDPPGLLYLDDESADAARRAGIPEPTRESPVPGALSAPTEVHMGMSDACTARCRGCYLDTRPGRGGEEPPHWRAHLEALAEMGVFEVALGGGESLHTDLPVQMARHARAQGLVPNLTTSGLGVTAESAAVLAPLMGQVNISLDGLGETYRAVRGWRGDACGLRAIAHLIEAGVRVGVNTVIVRENYGGLRALGAVLAEAGVEEWQWLRFKPSGRGVDTYDEMKLTPEQALDLWPLALEIERETGLRIRFDCAMVPFLAAHEPPLEALRLLGVSGCPGGESLWTVSASGAWLPCSFAEGLVPEGTGPLRRRWRSDEGLRAWRARAANPPEPCASCPYRTVCRGGCRVVAAHRTGDPLAADPECPRVAG